MQTATRPTKCVHCDDAIEHEPAAGWVSARSGDEGGTYDECDYSPNGRHAPSAQRSAPFTRSPALCDALAVRGTGTGACDRPVDASGYCDRAAAHVDTWN